MEINDLILGRVEKHKHMYILGAQTAVKMTNIENFSVKMTNVECFVIYMTNIKTPFCHQND